MAGRDWNEVIQSNDFKSLSRSRPNSTEDNVGRLLEALDTIYHYTFDHGLSSGDKVSAIQRVARQALATPEGEKP
jgi:hypothetical protein